MVLFVLVVYALYTPWGFFFGNNTFAYQSKKKKKKCVCAVFSEFSTTCQEYIPNLLLPPRKNGRSVATNKGWEGIKLASEQSFVVIGYGVQKHKQKLGYLDEDVQKGAALGVMPKPKSMNKSPEKRGIDPFLQACTKSPRVFMKFLEVK